MGDYELDDYEAITAKMIEVYNSLEVQQALRVMDSIVQNFEFKNTDR